MRNIYFWPWTALCGLAYGYITSENLWHFALQVGLVSCCWLGCWLRPWRGLVLTGLIGILIGCLQVGSLQARHAADPLKDLDGLWADISGVVVSSPARSPKTVRFLLAMDRLEDHPGVRPARLEVILVGEKDLPDVAVGERWRMTGRLAAPPGPGYPQGPDRRLQLARKGIWHQFVVQLRGEQCDRLVPTQLDSPWGAVMRLRVKLTDCFRRRFEGRQAELLVGIVLGESQGLDEELQQAFRATGTSHLLAASGANVMILLGVLLWLGERCGYSSYRLAFPCLAAVWLTVALAGFSPSVVRAGWMSAVALLARGLGRRVSIERCLSLGCLISLCCNPEYLFDVSFQLSAGAVACLATLGQALSARVQNRVLKQMAITAAVLIGLWPVLAYHFQSCQPGALVANLLLAPPMESLLPIGLVLAGLDAIWPPLALPVVWVSKLMLTIVLWLVLKLAPVMPQWALTRPDLAQLLVWLLGTLGLLAWLHRRSSTAVLLWLGAIGAVFWQRVPSPPPGRLLARIVAERSRVALWLTTPTGQQILVIEDAAQQAPLETMLRVHGVANPDRVLLLSGFEKPVKGQPRLPARCFDLHTPDGLELEARSGRLRLAYRQLVLRWGGGSSDQQLPAAIWMGDGTTLSPAPLTVGGAIPRGKSKQGVLPGWVVERDGALELDSDGTGLRWQKWD